MPVGMERCYLCGIEGYVLMDNHWMCMEHYRDAEAMEPDASGE